MKNVTPGIKTLGSHLKRFTQGKIILVIKTDKGNECYGSHESNRL